MQIFLSFPSELESAAEEVAQSLRNRDYDVFFSHDDLPPGDSFDARVEAAISKSDFMVFLISPESVTKGRYTLTEMRFARDKWPNASKRVLPVMAVPTPLENVPRYLKGVTILEPEGNMAAETRAAVDRNLAESSQTSSSNNKALLPLAILALVSATGSYLALKYSPEGLKFSFLSASDTKALILAGVIFGCVVATCNRIFGVSDRFQLGLVIVIPTLAWIAAFDASLVTFGVFTEYSKPAGDAAANAAQATEMLLNNPIAFFVIGVVGGAVGGAITILGLLVTNPAFRRLESIMASWATAAVAGAVYGLARQYFFVVFAVWQILVTLAIVRGFSSVPAQLPAWLYKITASASYTSRGAG